MSARNSPPTPTTTSSTCAAATSSGTHVFEVTDYSLHRCLAAGRFLRSDTFHVGGYAWSILFYPGGDTYNADSGDYVAVNLELMTNDATVTASYDMALVDPATGARWLGARFETATLDTGRAGGFRCWCLSRLKRRSELEASPFLRDDRLVIECTLTVHEVRAVPPSLEDSPAGRHGDGTDVQAESLLAHMMVLAVVSPVFRARLERR